MAAALVSAASAGASVFAAPGFWSAAWTDPRGDAGSGPDVTVVQLGASDAGDVLLHVYPPPNANDPSSLLQVFIATADRPAEGDPTLAGANLQLTYNYREGTVSAADWDEPTHRWYPGWFSIPGDQLGILVAARDDGTTLVIPTGILSRSNSGGNVRVFVRLGTTEQYDQAPDSGSYQYNVQPLALTGTAFSATGKRVGERLVLSVAVKRSDTGGYLAEGRISCTATSGAHKVRGASLGFVEPGTPFARCGCTLPSSFKGKRVEASITVAFVGRSIVRTTSFRLR